MAFFTALLKDVCEQLAEQEGSYTTIIPLAQPKIFDFSYEFWDSDGKEEFEKSFIKHFYMRELGFETYYLWKMRLDDKFNTVLPYYNKRFAALAKEYDPLITDIESVTIHRTGSTTGTSESTQSGTSNSTNSGEAHSNGENTSSELPMGQLSNFRDNTYLSDASGSKSDSTTSGSIQSSSELSSSGETTGTSTGDETRTVSGTHSNQSELIQKYLSLQKNILMEFFNECDDLFMKVWW